MVQTPAKWFIGRFGDIAYSVKGKKPKSLISEKTKDSLPYIDIKAFERNVFESYTEDKSCPSCEPDDVLLVWDGARCGLVGTGASGIIGSTLAKIETSVSDKRLLYYFLLSKYHSINKRAKGVGIPHVNPNLLWELDFPLPPLPEQHRIVAKIEELFSDLDAGIAALKKAKDQLKTYRQSVLKWAFEGKLTEEWRKKNKSEPASELLKRIKAEREKKYKEECEKAKKEGTRPPKTPVELPPISEEELERLPKLPEGWGWVKLQNFVFEVKDGTHDTPKYVEVGIPFVTQKNIREYGFDMSDVNFISELDHNKFYQRSNVAIDDIIISMIGHNRGMSCIVNNVRTFSIKNVGLVKLFLILNNNKYVYWYMKSRIGQRIIQAQSKGGAQAFIGLTELRNWPIIICSIEEQSAIVSEIESRLSLSDNLEKTIDESLSKASALRQSILKHAFEGKLVPQDPNDEPAEKLLERIKGEKRLNHDSCDSHDCHDSENQSNQKNHKNHGSDNVFGGNKNERIHSRLRRS